MMPPFSAGYHPMFDNPYWATGGNIQRGPSYTGDVPPGQGGYSPYLPPSTPPIFYDGTLPGDPGTPGGRPLIPGDPNYGVTNPVRTPQPISVQPYAPPTQQEIADRQNLFGSFGDFAPDTYEPPGGGFGLTDRARGNPFGGPDVTTGPTLPGDPDTPGGRLTYGYAGDFAPGNSGARGFYDKDQTFGWAPPRWGQRAGSVASMLLGGGLPGMLVSGLTGRAFDATRDRNFAAKEAMRGILGMEQRGDEEGVGRDIDNPTEAWADLYSQAGGLGATEGWTDPLAASPGELEQAIAMMQLGQMQTQGLEAWQAGHQQGAITAQQNTANIAAQNAAANAAQNKAAMASAVRASADRAMANANFDFTPVAPGIPSGAQASMDAHMADWAGFAAAGGGAGYGGYSGGYGGGPAYSGFGNGFEVDTGR